MAIDEFDGHFYQVIGGLRTFDDAAEYAASLSLFGVRGHLATISTQAEQDFLTNLQAIGWLGTHDLWVEGSFHYSTGPERYSPIRFSAFAVGHPTGGWVNDCVYFNEGVWLDEPCNITLPAILEFECAPGYQFSGTSCQRLPALALPMRHLTFMQHGTRRSTGTCTSSARTSKTGTQPWQRRR